MSRSQQEQRAHHRTFKLICMSWGSAVSAADTGSLAVPPALRLALTTRASLCQSSKGSRMNTPMIPCRCTTHTQLTCFLVTMWCGHTLKQLPWLSTRNNQAANVKLQKVRRCLWHGRQPEDGMQQEPATAWARASRFITSDADSAQQPSPESTLAQSSCILCTQARHDKSQPSDPASRQSNLIARPRA